jgi:phosphinothricin acetyltransferase
VTRTRAASFADAEAIARIYNEGVADRVAAFETAPRTTEDMTHG